MYRGVDLVLPLSDHADFDDLVRLARESGAQRIITMHGAKKFADHLRDLGLNAEYLAPHPSQQKSAKGTPKKAASEVEQRLFE
jgi:Cft2 family RNA processing exonuclease